MIITRRGFIGSLFAGIIVNPAQALVLGDRYHQLVTMLADMKSTMDQLNVVLAKPMNVQYDRRRELCSAFNINEKVEAIVTHLYLAFGDTSDMHSDIERSRSLVRSLMTGELKIDMLSEEELRKHEDYIVSISVIRYLLVSGIKHGVAGLCVPFQPQKIKHFGEFALRYKDAIFF